MFNLLPSSEHFNINFTQNVAQGTTICCNPTQFIETEIEALPDTLVTNTPSVKMLCPQNKSLVLKVSRKHNMLKCWSIEGRPGFCVSCTIVYRWVTNNCCSKNDNTQWVSALSKVIHLPEDGHCICRSGDRASWKILTIKPTRCIKFSTLFLE